MPSYLAILSATLPVFLLMGLGFLFQRKQWLSEETEMGVMRLSMQLLFPCLVLTLIPGNPALATISSGAWAIGLGFAMIVIGFALSWLVAWALRMRRGEGLRTFTITAGIQNYGFLTLPIAVQLFPDNEGPAGLVFVHGIGVEIAMWTFGLAILSGKMGLRSLLNIPFLAVVSALILNYTGLYHYIPGVLKTVMDMLGRCSVPMAVFIIGATMGRFSREGIFSDIWRVACGSVLTRLGLMAMVILAAAKFAPIEPDLKRLLVIQAGMPSAIFPIVLARLYGGTPLVAVQVVLATSLVSVATVPLVLAWGLSWVAP